MKSSRREVMLLHVGLPLLVQLAAFGPSGIVRLVHSLDVSFDNNGVRLYWYRSDTPPSEYRVKVAFWGTD